MKKKLFSLILASAVLAGCLTGCGAEDKASRENTEAPLTPVTLNEVAHSIFYAPMYVAIEEGYFAEEGIDLTLVTGFGADKTMTAVLTGEADIGFMGSEASIYTYLGGQRHAGAGHALAGKDYISPGGIRISVIVKVQHGKPLFLIN